MKKYRMVEDNSNGKICYIIEKNVRFLFWSWWSQKYLNHISGCYHYSDKNDCENMLHYLNKESDVIEHKCYFS